MKLDLLLPFLLVFSLFFKSSDPDEPTPPHQYFCESHSVMEHLLKERKDIEAKHLKYEADWVQRQTNPAPKSSMEYVLPVVVHIIHDNGAANISDVLVEQGIQHLNQAFANTDYYDQGTGVNTSFQFCLAQRDPDGNATFGINRIVSPLTAMNLEADDLAVKNLSRWDPTQYVNIWLVREICSASSGCGVAGYAYLPAAHGSDVDGIVMEASWFGSSPGQSAVQVHEMGHYLGLYHTFEGGCGNDDCVVDGDRVCDTPPDQSTAQVPCEGTANSCFTDTDSGFTTDQNDMFINYMDYGDFDCYSAFTQGQTDRMVFTIEGIRQSLLLSQACLDPCPVDITANFTVPTTTIPIGTSLNFTNTSTNATTYSWSIGSIIFSSDTNSSFVFNDLGVFVVELTSTNSDPNCIAIARDTIEVFCPVEASYDISNANPLPGEIINFTNTSTAATTFSWTVNGMIQSTDTDYNTSFSTEGSYLVCLEANNGFCEDEECFFVIATIEEPCSSNSALITYGTPATDEMGDFLLPIPSGGMLMASTQNGEIVLSELDADLNPIWHQSLPITNNIDRIYELKLDSDNMLLGVGFTNVVNNNRFAYVFKYDYQNLDIIWTKRISGNDNTPALFSILEESPGGDYLLFGQTWPNNAPGAGCDATMIQIDRISGAQQFAKNFQLGSCETFQKAILHNSSIYTTGRFNAAGGGTNKMRPAVSQIDPFGNMIWSRLYLVSVADNARLYTSAIIEDGGDLVVLGRGDLTGSSATANIIFLYKIESNGEIIWAREYDIPSGNSERTRNLVAVPDGYLALTNYREGSTPASILLKTDKDGELQWAKQFGSGGTMTAGRLEVIGDNIFILGGTDFYGAGGSDIFIAKLDLNGDLLMEGCAFVEDIQLTDTPIFNPYDDPITLIEYDSPYDMIGIGHNDVDTNLEPMVQCQEECVDCEAEIIVSPEPPTDCDPTTLSLESECDFSTYYWTFCEPELTALPEIEPNIAAGDIPTMCDFVDATADGSGYHLFVTNYNTATERLRRLDFGDDINSVPTTTIIDLPGIPNTTDLIKNEGIDIIQSNGQYYGFFTVWNQIYRIEFGTDITNVNPGVFLVTGYENAPIWWSVSLDLYQIEGQWWGIHTARSGELTILFWGDNVSGDVQAALSYTGESGAEFTGATYIEEAGNHYVLACDFQNGLMRFDFGTSLLNPPTMTNLGFFGTGLQWSVAAYRECEDGYLGFLFKETGDDHKVIRFSPSITSTPVVVNTINGLDRVNGTSSLHRVEDDLVFFVTRSYSQSVARLYYEGCNGVDIPNSTDPNPVVQFPEPGDYTVRVIVNEGLPDQLALCEQITVEACANELCDDGIDNDGDGLIDCADADLADSCCCLVPLPLDLGPDQLVCDFGVTVLQPEEEYASYRWQDGSTEASYTAFNPGTYWLEVTDSCGNILTDTIQIVVEEITVLELGPDLSICAGDTVQFSFSAFDQYEWFPSTGIDCATCPEVNISPDSTTMYTLVASSDLGCYSVDSVLIEVSGELIRLDTIFLCAGDTAIIYGEQVFTTGTYAEIIPVPNGCDSVFVTDVIVLDSIMLAIEMEQPCDASGFGAIMTDISGGLAPYSISWIGPDGFTSTETDLRDILAGSYTLEIEDAFGCELTLVLDLDVANEVMLALEVVDVTCFGGGDGILYLEGDDAYTYSLDGITYDANPVYSGLSAGPYTLYIQDGNGCVFERLFAVFEPTPLLLLLPDDQTIGLGDSLLIEAQTSDATGLTYSWSPDNRLSCTDCPAPIASPWETTLYTLVVENEAGCSVTEDILITLGQLPKVYIPNAFSPNDDTVNDRFTIYSGSGVAAINKLSVFDRWGELVFENTNFQPNDPLEGWDGKFRGELMDVGIFVYVAEIEFINGLTKVYSGDFLLLR